jgi:hypothetical protein
MTMDDKSVVKGHGRCIYHLCSVHDLINEQVKCINYKRSPDYYLIDSLWCVHNIESGSVEGCNYHKANKRDV